jgi:hypothetical protein
MMKKIYESVTFGIVAVYELGNMIREERYEDKREDLEAIRFAYYYLIKQMCEQFGCTRFNIVDSMVENGYERRDAMVILSSYESWASHIIEKSEDNL